MPAPFQWIRLSSLMLTIRPRWSIFLSRGYDGHGIPYHASEKDGFITAYVAREGDLSGRSEVRVVSSNLNFAGAAVAPEDYTAIDTTLVFLPGEVEKTVTIPIANDGIKEDYEAFELNLLNPVGAVFNSPTNRSGLIGPLKTTHRPSIRPPLLDAGLNQTITLPDDTAFVRATVSDDGLPAGGTKTGMWSLLSGPAGVHFSIPSKSDLTGSTVTFTSSGTYVLEFTAGDGEFTSSDTVTIMILRFLPITVLQPSSISARRATPCASTPISPQSK